jgi:hypothetical protein
VRACWHELACHVQRGAKRSFAARMPWLWEAVPAKCGSETTDTKSLLDTCNQHGCGGVLEAISESSCADGFFVPHTIGDMHASLPGAPHHRKLARLRHTLHIRMQFYGPWRRKVFMWFANTDHEHPSCHPTSHHSSGHHSLAPGRTAAKHPDCPPQCVQRLPSFVSSCRRQNPSEPEWQTQFRGHHHSSA